MTIAAMPERVGRIRGLVAINITGVIFGTAALFGKLAVSPFWIIGVRSAVATLTMLVWGHLSRELKPVPRAQWGGVATSAAVMIVSWYLFYSTVQQGSVAIATLTFATFPLFALMFESWHRRRRPRALELAATAAILAAVYFVVGGDSTGASPWSVGAGLGSAALYALFWHVGRSLRPALSETMVTISQTALITVFAAPFLPWVDRPPVHLGDWGWLVWFGAVNTALASQLYLYSLRHLSASSCGAFVAMEPIYAISFAAILFHEPISTRTAVGGVVILGASYLLSRIESDPAISPDGVPDGHEI
jgi:drug/metabolite transporter (DMT)-like permease